MQMLKLFDRYTDRLKFFRDFFIGQFAAQAFGFLIGFLLLRWLSVDAYAQFSVAFSFQSTLNSLVELGLGGSIIPLVGSRVSDAALVGKYIASARALRNLLFFCLLPFAALIFPWIVARHQWSWSLQALLFSSAVASVVFQSEFSYYNVVLLMHRQMKRVQFFQLLISLFKLGLSAGFYLGGLLSGWLVAWINSLSLLLAGRLLRRQAQPFFEDSADPDPLLQKELRGYIAPLVPGLIFTAFQGQISTLLIAVFGRETGIAEVSALGRLAQLFLLLSTFNSMVIGPYFARMDRHLLPLRYTQCLMSSIGVAIVLSVGALNFPDLLLWLLGDKYASLKLEVGLSVIGAGIGYVSSLMWAMHSARKWIYWWSSPLLIGATLLSQAAGILYFDLSTTRGVLYLSIATTATNVLVNLVTTVAGFRKHARETAAGTAQ